MKPAKSKSTDTTAANNDDQLAETAREIKQLERGSVENARRIGELLAKVWPTLEYGALRAWLRREFAWSHRTALRYRAIFLTARMCQLVTFDGLDITLTAVYFAAEQDEPAARAIFDAAKTRRVNFDIAREIAEGLRPLEEPASEDVEFDCAEDVGDNDADDDGDDGEAAAEPLTPLAKALLALTTRKYRSDDWGEAVRQVGVEKVRRLTLRMVRTCQQLRVADAVNLAADRAEARSAAPH